MSTALWLDDGAPPTDRGDERSTDPALFAALAGRFGGFTLDAAASAENAKCARYIDEAANGLERTWVGERVWCNPPYSEVRAWVEKAWVESSICPLIVMLLPANRCEQAWWQDLIEPYRDRHGSCLTVEFLPGRPRFMLPGQLSVAPHERPPFGCCILVWRPLKPAPPAALPFDS